MAGLHEHTQQYFGISAPQPVVQQWSPPDPLSPHRAALPECPVALSEVRVRSGWDCSVCLPSSSLFPGGASLHVHTCKPNFGSSELSGLQSQGVVLLYMCTHSSTPLTMYRSLLPVCPVALIVFNQSRVWTGLVCMPVPFHPLSRWHSLLWAHSLWAGAGVPAWVCTQQHTIHSGQGSPECEYHKLFLTPHCLWAGKPHLCMLPAAPAGSIFGRGPLYIHYGALLFLLDLAPVWMPGDVV